MFGFFRIFFGEVKHKYGYWSSPIKDDTTTDSQDDQYLRSLFRDQYFVNIKKEDGFQDNKHPTRGGAKKI